MSDVFLFRLLILYEYYVNLVVIQFVTLLQISFFFYYFWKFRKKLLASMTTSGNNIRECENVKYALKKKKKKCRKSSFVLNPRKKVCIFYLLSKHTREN